MASKKDEFSIKNISPKLGGERGTRNPNGPTSSHDLVEQMEFLYVEVIKATTYSESNPIPYGSYPIVEVTLGNYKSSTATLPFGPNGEWNQLVFAFDKTKGDVLSVTLKLLDQAKNSTVVGKRDFKLAADIPSRVPPDAKIAPQRYSMQNTENGYHMELQMSIWFGTQADEVYSHAWFWDASLVNASCVINTRPQTYIAPRLFYVRVTIVSGLDLISNDGKRTPSVYVSVILGKVELKTGISSGSNPSWNQDLLFVASDLNLNVDDTAYIKLIDRVDDQHEECIGILTKKLSDMTTLKVPGSAPVSFYNIEPPVKVEPAGDERRFFSKIKMKLAIDQAYYVSEECSLYSSDYRAYAKGLWPGVIGRLEVGILGATGLQTMKEWGSKETIDAYVVAKYGNKWARTRTIVDNSAPKWNEQYTWEVYDKCTVITFGLYDNFQILAPNHMNDVPIGKVRIRLSKLIWNKTYTLSIPILGLGKGGLKKSGELQLAIRCVCVAPDLDARVTAPFRWMLPKAHYKSPLSLLQIKALRIQAVEINCMNLARKEPPLRKEVVMDMLKPSNTNFSMRKIKANCERLYRLARTVYSPYAWLDESVISPTGTFPKLVAFGLCVLIIFIPEWILWIACWVIPCFVVSITFWEIVRFVDGEYLKNMLGIGTLPPPLILFDLKLSKLESPNVDELAEELDSFPTSEMDENVVRMRYDRLRKMSGEVMTLLGDIASQGERFLALLTFNGDSLASFYFWIISYAILLVVYFGWNQVRLQKFFACSLVFYWLNFPFFRNNLPTGIKNFFRRLPTNEDLML